MADIKAEVSAEYSRLIREQTRQVDLESFRERGMTKVNVINARQINELIEKAVESVIGRMDKLSAQAVREDKSQIILDSMAEFRRLFKEQQENKAKPVELETDKTATMVVEALETHMRELKSWHVAAQAKAAQELHQRESEAESSRGQLAANLDSLSLSVARLADRPDGPSPEQIAEAVASSVGQAIAPISEAIKQAVAPLDESLATSRRVQALVRKELGEIAKAVETLNAGVASINESAKAQSIAIASTAEAIEQTLSHRLKSVAAENKTETVQLVSTLQTTLQGLDRRLEDLAQRLGAVSQESAAIEGRIEGRMTNQMEALGSAVGQMMQSMKGLNSQITAAMERPAGVDPTSLSEAISTAVGQAQNDLLSRLERQGLVRTGTSDERGADEAVASAVIKSAFRELDSGTTESHMGSIAKSREVKGDSAALDRLKKLRGK